MAYRKPNVLYYRIAQAASWFVATFVFRRKILRNEIKGKKGAFVVIANHEAALDFVNLIGLNHRPMTFVISNSFYNSLPLTGFMDHMGVIPKQQFQTTLKDMKRIKEVVDHDRALVIYPAGLMCEDGLSTPIPKATYKFLKWLGTDIYVARTSGTYFAMPKWSKKLRPGRTYMDVYQLFSRDELETLDLATIRRRTEEALLFDAYRDQEKLQVRYSDNIEGLENVLYLCPHCKTEFSMRVKDQNTIYCTECGYAATSDACGFLHSECTPALRYVSDWSKLIHEDLRGKLMADPAMSLTAKASFHMLEGKKRKKYVEVGEGTLTLANQEFRLTGYLRGEAVDLRIPAGNLPSLPFNPARYLEIQHGSQIYRCVLEDHKQVMKFINMIKIYYEMNTAVPV